MDGLGWWAYRWMGWDGGFIDGWVRMVVFWMDKLGWWVYGWMG